MRKITRRGRFHCWLATSLAVGLGLGLAPAAPRQSRASQIASRIKLDAEDLDHLIVLDQNGQTIQLPTKQQSGPVVLTDGAVPRYIVYQVGGDDPLPKGFPTVDSGSANSNQTTTGPLHLDALVKAQLDQTLAKHGRAAVYNGQDIYLVKPLPPLFGTTGSWAGTTLAWLASQRSTSSSSSGTTQASVPIPAASIQAQPLIPTSITNDYQLQVRERPGTSLHAQVGQAGELESAIPGRLGTRPEDRLAQECGTQTSGEHIEASARGPGYRRHRLWGNSTTSTGPRARPAGRFRFGRSRLGRPPEAGRAQVMS
jgi:hypothetical protein